MEQLSRMPIPTREQLERSAQAFFGELAREIDQPRHFDPDHFDEEVNWNVEESRDRVHRLDDQLVNNVFDGAVQQRAVRIVELAGGMLHDLSDHDRLFALQLAARAEREQMSQLIHLLTKPALTYEHSDRIFSSSAPTSISALPLTIVPSMSLGRPEQVWARVPFRGSGSPNVDADHA